MPYICRNCHALVSQSSLIPRPASDLESWEWAHPSLPFPFLPQPHLHDAWLGGVAELSPEGLLHGNLGVGAVPVPVHLPVVHQEEDDGVGPPELGQLLGGVHPGHLGTAGAGGMGGAVGGGDRV